MPDTDPTTSGQKPRSTAWQTALTLLQEAGSDGSERPEALADTFGG
ncbi:MULTISPECIES: hypothetical protein [unclassified Streptosporangium]|nr:MULTISPECIES: hypothetical protein [unclassified Streptosporangium]